MTIPRYMLRPVSWSATRTTMHPCRRATRDAKLALTLPEHVLSIIDGWAAVELQATPEEVLEAIAAALCTAEELRQYAAELFEE